jgi:hypothetical protein
MNPKQKSLFPFRVSYFLSFISLPENPRLLSLGMNGTRNGASKAGEVEANPA